jgi:hypothetical protein
VLYRATRRQPTLLHGAFLGGGAAAMSPCYPRTSPYAASTASHTCRIMALGLVISDVSNCPFLILLANSIPLNVTSAFPNVLNPSIG